VYRHAEEPRKLEKAESKRIGGGFKPTTGVSKELLKAMGARSARAVEAGESATGCGGGGGGSGGSSGAAKAKGGVSVISNLLAAKTAGKKLSASLPRKSASPAGGTGAAKDKDSSCASLACSIKPAAKASGSTDGGACNTHNLTRVSSNSSRSSSRTKDVSSGAALSASSAGGGATRSKSSSGAEAPGEGPRSGGGKASVQAERADAPAGDL